MDVNGDLKPSDWIDPSVNLPLTQPSKKPQRVIKRGARGGPTLEVERRTPGKGDHTMFIRCNMRWAVVSVMIAGLALVPASPAEGEEEQQVEAEAASEDEAAESSKPRQRNWRMRIIGVIAGDESGVVVGSGHPHAGVSVSGGGGVGVNFEYRTSPAMGFEIGAMAVGGNVRVGVDGSTRYYGGAVEVDGYVPITFALNYHPIKNSEIVDFYVGPLAASTFISSVGVGPGVIAESRVDFGLGANIGVDINFGRMSRWSFNTGFKYIANVSNSGDRDDQWDFDPLIISFGFGLRF
jgi:outer membrane protein W